MKAQDSITSSHTNIKPSVSEGLYVKRKKIISRSTKGFLPGLEH